jgi:hypothetical protein
MIFTSLDVTPDGRLKLEAEATAMVGWHLRSTW